MPLFSDMGDGLSEARSDFRRLMNSDIEFTTSRASTREVAATAVDLFDGAADVAGSLNDLAYQRQQIRYINRRSKIDTVATVGGFVSRLFFGL